MNPGPVNSEFKIFHLNINGLRNKVDELETEVSGYDIVIITETKLNVNNESKNIILQEKTELTTEVVEWQYTVGIIQHFAEDLTLNQIM